MTTAGRDRSRDERRAALFGTVFRVLIVAVTGLYLAFGLLTASRTLGCDFLAYHNAAQRLLAQDPIYDLSITRTGGCGLYQYPPPFVLIALPFSLLGFGWGTWAWIGFLVACFVGGALLMPVRREIRWAMVLAGGVGWPFIYGVRIGQVGPILLLVFALGWRFLDRPQVVGLATGIGTLVKLQPALLLGWLAARRDWRAVAWGLATIAVGAGVAAAIGLGAWVDFITLLRNLTNALTVPANLSIGAVAYAYGAGVPLASAIQAANIVALLVVVVVAATRTSREAGYLVTVVASQVISPIVWDHYALVLLLPVAWLLERRQWWAVLIPLSEAWVLLPFMPTVAYPIAFYVTLAGVLAVGWRRQPRPALAESLAA
jgi:hypothetical protein